jgi:endonuclease YncB( thermonuclease family)
MSLFKIKNPFKYVTRHLFSPKSENPERIKDDNNDSDLKVPEHIKELETQINQQNQQNQIKEIEIKKIRIIKWEETTAFIPPISGGQVIKVYDGDSITIAGYLPMYNSPLFRFSVRLNGIDTAEIKGKSEDEIEAAKQARDALTKLILHKEIILKNVGTEKYGRVLADVYLDDLCINDWLIKECYAVKYDGGTKKSPKSWLKYKVTGEKE